jgi:hypothetical protein
MTVAPQAGQAFAVGLTGALHSMQGWVGKGPEASCWFGCSAAGPPEAGGWLQEVPLRTSAVSGLTLNLLRTFLRTSRDTWCSGTGFAGGFLFSSNTLSLAMAERRR